MLHSTLQDQNDAPNAKRCSADITNNSERLQNTARHQCDLGGTIYPGSIKIFVSTSTFAKDMQNQ